MTLVGLRGMFRGIQRGLRIALPPSSSNRGNVRSNTQHQQQANRSQPAAGHGRIPDDRFRASFGHEHTFHVNRSDFEGGSRRFQYGGFWFTAVDPWPVGWLYTDNVYVDYINGGYFLCNPSIRAYTFQSTSVDVPGLTYRLEARPAAWKLRLRPVGLFALEDQCDRLAVRPCDVDQHGAIRGKGVALDSHGAGLRGDHL